MTETTISVPDLGPTTRAVIAGALGVQACLDALAMADLTETHKETLRFLAGTPDPEPEAEPDPVTFVAAGDYVRAVTEDGTVIHGPVVDDPDGLVLVCETCGLDYPLTPGKFTTIEDAEPPLGQVRLGPDGQVAFRVGGKPASVVWDVTSKKGATSHTDDYVQDWPILHSPPRS